MNGLQITYQLSGPLPAGMALRVQRTRQTAQFIKATASAPWTLLEQEGPTDDSPGAMSVCLRPSPANTIFSNDTPGISLIGSQTGLDGRPVPVTSLGQVNTPSGRRVPAGTYALCYRASFVEWVESSSGGAFVRISPQIPWHSVATAHMAGTPPRPVRMPGQANEVGQGAIPIPGPPPP